MSKPQEVRAGPTWVNPVAAGLVRDIDDWPGLLLGPHNGLGKTYSADMPSFFFRKRSRTVPASASTHLAKPPQFSEAADEDFAHLVNQELARRTEWYRAEHAKKNKRFLGARRVLKQNWLARPRTSEPRRVRNPRVAAKETALRVRLIEAHLRFVAHYREARDAWRRGRRRTRFPAGTYWMRWFHGVRCEPAPT